MLLLLCGDIESNPGPVNKQSCSVLYCNIRGLHGNHRELCVASRSSDLVLCVETLISTFRHDVEVMLPVFSPPEQIRRGSMKRAQGLSCYIREGFPAHRQRKYECRCHEVMVIRVCARVHNFYLYCVYRNPDCDDSVYSCLMASMLSVQESDPKAGFVFVGDFNAHHREWLQSASPTNNHGVSALDFAQVTDCTQLVHQPTHRSGNCLDLLFTDIPDLIDVSVGSPIGTSDHSSVHFRVALCQPTVQFSIRKTVLLKHKANWNVVRSDVSEIRWGEVYRDPDPIRRIESEFSSIIERRVPSTTLRFRSGDKHWFNAECRAAHSEKQRAYRVWSRCRTLVNWDSFVQVRTTAEETYSVAQREYHTVMRSKLLRVTNSHKWWTTLKSAVFGASPSLPPLMGPGGGLVTEPGQKAQLLMSHFDAKQNRDSVSLPHSCRREPVFRRFAFRSKEVYRLLRDLDLHGGVDPGGIFPMFLGEVADIVAPKLSVIFRGLIRGGRFPLSWRVANITAVPKGSVSPQISEYRPISITMILSKVFEKLVAPRLYRYLEGSGHIPCQQFAYRKGLGTCDALLTISHTLQEALDSGHEARLVQLDFSAAFDRVNHLALLYKLSMAGVGGSMLSIIEQFLSNRTQRVIVDGQPSATTEVISGVP